MDAFGLFAQRVGSALEPSRLDEGDVFGRSVEGHAKNARAGSRAATAAVFVSGARRA